MYSICKSTHPATGVEHAITCYFFNRSEKCLVVAGANIIRVFRLIPDVDTTKREKYTGMYNFLFFSSSYYYIKITKLSIKYFLLLCILFQQNHVHQK